MNRAILLFIFLSFGFSCCSQKAIDEIVVIGIEDTDENLIIEIQNICRLSPKVLAVDVQFPHFEASKYDTLLKAALASCDRVVLPFEIMEYALEKKNYTETLEPHLFFRGKSRIGFVNAILEPDAFGTLKKFSIKELINGKEEFHFAVRTAMSYDSLRTMAYIKNKPKIIDVQYLKDQSRIKSIRASYAIYNDIMREDIEGKIVLLGAIWTIEGEVPDIFVSPLNENPEMGADMWGVMHLANIVAQVLNGG